MIYNPAIHHRRSIRLKGYDYSQEGLYFITICIQHRKCLFGKIINDEMILNEYGIVARQQWQELPDRFKNMEPDVFQIMPNHMHAIIAVGATLAVAHNAVAHNAVAHNAVAPGNTIVLNETETGAGTSPKTRAGASPAPTVGDIVGAYKSLVANDCLEIFKQTHPGKMMGKLWQRNYYEHIIRDDQSYQRISEYIINNPAKWKGDKFYDNNR